MKIKNRVLILSVIGCLAVGAAGCGSSEKQPEPTTMASVEVETVSPEPQAESAKETEIAKESTSVVIETEKVPVTVETDQAIPETLCGVPTYMDYVVGKAILEENAGHYPGGECQGEGHIILEEIEEDGISTIYALIMYGEYGFQNVDYFIKTAGTGAIPVVMQFDLRLSSHTPLLSMEWPMDGNMYNESIKRMFPEHLWDRVLTIQKEDMETLTEMERSYAKAYLADLGRDAVIGDYGDLEHVLLTQLGVSVDVSNKMSVYEKEMGPYPYWQGRLEKVEDGVRYMYSTFFDEETNQIIYEKRVFDTHETIEKYVFDAETGEPAETE